jgi:hypothetical protein
VVVTFLEGAVPSIAVEDGEAVLVGDEKIGVTIVVVVDPGAGEALIKI